MFLKKTAAAFSTLRFVVISLLAFTSLSGGALLAAPPQAPTGLTAFVDGNSQVLLWNDNSTNETIFQVAVTINGSPDDDINLTSNSTAITGRTTAELGYNLNTVYTFRIRAINAAGESSAYTNTITVAPSSLGAPSALTATALPNGVVQLDWIDNAAAEAGFQVDRRLLPNGSFENLGGINPNILSVVISQLAPASSYEFRVRAFSGTTHAVSNVATVTTPAFPAPGNLVAIPLSASSIQLTWQDNTSNETGFFVEQRELPGGAFTNLGRVGANSSSVSITELNPTKQYEFRIRAFIESGGQAITFSSYSNVAAAASFLVAPSALTATPEVNGTVSLTWLDNSASETGFIVESRNSSSGPFVTLGTVGANVQAVTILSQAPSTPYEFRIRAFSGFLANPTALSAYSNIAAATTAVLAAPSNFTAVAVPSSPYLVSFSWSDNTVAEFGYEIEFRKQGGSDFTRRFLTGKNDTSAVISEWEPGTNYEFRIRAANGNQVSDYSAVVSATTRNGFSSPRYSPATVGSAFSFQLATLSQSPRVSWSASSLPAGLVFDSQTGIISGTPSTAGVFFIPLTATFADASTHPVNLELRILAPPEITSPFPPQTLLPGTSTTLALGSSFSSPGNHSAVRLTTSKGNIDILLATTTPLTVANFLGYVSRGDYTDVLFHRAPLGFVLQGGGFRSFAAPDVFQRIPSAGTILNEPGISNLTGTIAMAKVGGDPNSATSEFFFNLQNNAANLDFQNGGFTVFGRVSVPTFSGTVTPLSGLDRYNYAVGLNTPTGVVASNFTDLPMDQSPAPTVMDSSKIPKILAASPVPLLSYTLTSNSDPAVATAMVQGAELQINGLTAGTTLLTVTATDLDGNSRSQVISVQVQQTFAQWAASKQLPNGQNGPSDNPDQDSLPNLLEFAFFGNPSVNDVASPTASLAVDGASRFFEITFPVNKLAAGISYRVEASPSLNAASWSTLWTSTQGFAVPVVTATVDQPDRTMVTIRDPAGPPGTPRRFLRLAVTRAP